MGDDEGEDISASMFVCSVILEGEITFGCLQGILLRISVAEDVEATLFGSLG